MERKRVLITGATSGIGLATAEKFAIHNFDLVICGRRNERLNAFAENFKNLNITTLGFNITDKKEVVKALKSIENLPIDILINNAGNAHGLDFFQEGHYQDWEEMIDVNLKGLLLITQNVIPQMITSGKGHIINVGSIAGKEVYPKGNVYCATKHAVVALTEGMRKDLSGTGIKVSCINPGMVETEFSEVRYKGDINKAGAVYNGMKPLQARDVADTIFFMANRPDHVNIADLTILPTDQASATIIHRVSS